MDLLNDPMNREAMHKYAISSANKHDNANPPKFIHTMVNNTTLEETSINLHNTTRKIYLILKQHGNVFLFKQSWLSHCLVIIDLSSEAILDVNDQNDVTKDNQTVADGGAVVLVKNAVDIKIWGALCVFKRCGLVDYCWGLHTEEKQI